MISRIEISMGLDILRNRFNRKTQVTSQELLSFEEVARYYNSKDYNSAIKYIRKQNKYFPSPAELETALIGIRKQDTSNDLKCCIDSCSGGMMEYQKDNFKFRKMFLCPNPDCSAASFRRKNNIYRLPEAPTKDKAWKNWDDMTEEHWNNQTEEYRSNARKMVMNAFAASKARQEKDNNINKELPYQKEKSVARKPLDDRW